MILDATAQHLRISLIAELVGILIAVPLGILLTRRRSLSGPIIGAANLIQTVPSLALLGFMIPFLGVGSLPAIVALLLYSLLPILRNTYTGIMEVDSAIKEAGRGMGMTGTQLLFLVELPAAMPVIMAGVRVSTVLVIGWATLATFIGAGGLGQLIVSGLTLVRPEMIMAGAIPATLLALLADWGIGLLERRLMPKTRSRMA
ncbi:MAG: ABC transporter permease [Bacillota bacterium]